MNTRRVSWVVENKDRFDAAEMYEDLLNQEQKNELLKQPGRYHFEYIDKKTCKMTCIEKMKAADAN